MVAYRGHIKGDLAIWRGVDWFQPFTVTASGAAYNLTGYTAAAVVHSYAGGSLSAFTMTVALDAPQTLGTGTLTVLAAATAGVAAGQGYSYVVTLTPAGGTATAGHPPVIIYGDIEVRVR